MVRMSPEAFVFIGGEKEQFPGLFRKLDENHVPYHVIRGLDDHKQFKKLVREFTDLVHEIKPEYVHVQTNWQLAMVWLGRVKTGLRYKILYTIHGYRHNFRLRSYVARVLMGAALAIATERVFVCSTYVKNRFWFLGKKLRILYLGVDASFFDDGAMPQEEKFVGVIFSGEFRRGKNQEKLIEAVARCMKETDGANFRLYLPGRGAGLEVCRKTAHRLGIARSVVFPGQVDRIGMLKLYGKCQIAVVPSNAETFGFCIAEPMVLGLAVVSRPVGVALDVISHGRNGFIYRSERELIGLLKMLADDPDRRKMIGRTAAGDSRVFQWGTICGQYLDALGIERWQYEDSSAGVS